ncbi:MAG TPA: hypothetical protein VGG72_13075 [Bryobacteraceae bacterium]|jgi:hypothetical protein
MGLDRRNIIGLLAAGAVVAQIAEGQAAQPAPSSPDAELQAARQRLQSDTQRIAMVKLPQATEPACHFQA